MSVLHNASCKEFGSMMCLWQALKLWKMQLEIRSFNVTWRCDFFSLSRPLGSSGDRFFGNVSNCWLNSYGKFGGYGIFFAICEKPEGSDNPLPPPPGSARVKDKNVFDHWYQTDICIMFGYVLWISGLCSTQLLRADWTLTHVTIQVTQLWLNSNSKFANLTQLRLNSNPQFASLTQLRLNSFESELSQIWLTTHHILPNLAKRCLPGGGGVRSNVAVGCFFLCKTTDKCKILTFSRQKISDSALTQAVSSWLNSDSNGDQRDSTLTQIISLIFKADSTLTRLIWVRVESNLTHDSWVEHNPDGYTYYVRIMPYHVSIPNYWWFAATMSAPMESVELLVCIVGNGIGNYAGPAEILPIIETLHVLT